MSRRARRPFDALRVFFFFDQATLYTFLPFASFLFRFFVHLRAVLSTSCRGQLESNLDALSIQHSAWRLLSNGSPTQWCRVLGRDHHVSLHRSR